MLERPLSLGLLAALALAACDRPRPAPAPAAPGASDPATPALLPTATPAAAATPTSAPAATPTSTPVPTAAPAPTPAAIVDPTPIPPPKPPQAASAAPLLLSAAAVEPTGPVPLAHEAETVVDPAATFAVDLAVPVPDARLVLLDGREDHVPASHAREVGRTTRFSLSPASPLVPGSRYVLRLEGATGREMRDGHGGALAPLSFTLLAAGTPPPPPPPEPKPRPRRRR